MKSKHRTERNRNQLTPCEGQHWKQSGPAPLTPCGPPTLDLSVPDNVVAFASLRRVLHGASFAGVLQKRFSFYLVISFGTIVLISGVQLVRSRLEQAETFSIGVKVQSTTQLLMVSMCIVIQVVAAWSVNRYTSYHSSEIARARLSNLAQASYVEVGAGKREELMRAAFFLESLGSEVRSDDVANPVRVGFFRANVGVLSGLTTLLSGLLYFDLQVLFEALARSTGVETGAGGVAVVGANSTR